MAAEHADSGWELQKERPPQGAGLATKSFFRLDSARSEGSALRLNSLLTGERIDTLAPCMPYYFSTDHKLQHTHN